MIISLSNFFLLMNHPISLGLTLLIQITIIATNLKLNNSNSWFSYILFIIMIGGLMIIFIYMTSTSSNKKFTFKNKTLVMLTILTLLSMMINENGTIKNNEPLNFFLKYIYSNDNYVIMIMISYIFIALIAVSNLTKIKQGPLRKI